MAILELKKKIQREEVKFLESIEQLVRELYIIDDEPTQRFELDDSHEMVVRYKTLTTIDLDVYRTVEEGCGYGTLKQKISLADPTLRGKIISTLQKAIHAEVERLESELEDAKKAPIMPQD